MLAVELLCVAISLFGCAAAQSWQAVLLWLMVKGFFASSGTTAFTFLADFMPADERNTTMSQLGAVTIVFVLAAPAVGAWLYSYDPGLPFVVAGAVDVLARAGRLGGARARQHELQRDGIL